MARLVLLLPLLLAIPFSVEASEPLWLQAIEAAGRARQWTPGVALISIEVANDQGKVLDSWQNEYRLHPDGAGGATAEVVRSQRNGVDVTQKEREAQAKREAQARRDGQAGRDGAGRSRAASSPIPALDNPFDPELQPSAEIRPLGERRTIGSRPCIRYQFTVRKKDGSRMEGTAWIEETTGLPVEAAWTPSPLPRGARSLQTTVRYGGRAGEALPMEVRIEATGALLFFKRIVRSIMTLDAWWRNE